MPYPINPFTGELDRIADTSGFADTFTTDNGDAMPLDGVIIIAGGNGISTSGADNTVTIDMMTDFLGDFTFTSDVDGVPEFLTVQHTVDTADSDAALVAEVAGDSGGDPYQKSSVGTTRSYAQGIDNSDDDIFKLNTDASATVTPSSGTNLMNMTSDGEQTLPLQPAFLATLSATDVDVTGDGTTYTLGSGNVLTLIYNRGGNITTGGVFTAPITGIYCFMWQIKFGTVTAGNTSVSTTLVTSNRSYSSNLSEATDIFQGNNFLEMNGCTYADMDAGDTAFITGNISGGNLVNAVGGNNTNCRFSGKLVC